MENELMEIELAELMTNNFWYNRFWEINNLRENMIACVKVEKVNVRRWLVEVQVSKIDRTLGIFLSGLIFTLTSHSLRLNTNLSLVLLRDIRELVLPI